MTVNKDQAGRKGEPGPFGYEKTIRMDLTALITIGYFITKGY